MGTIESDKVLEEIALLLSNGKQVLFTPRGVSMRPFIEGGKDTVTLVKKPTVAVGDIVLVHIGNRYILHRVYKLSTPKLDDNSTLYTLHSTLTPVLPRSVRVNTISVDLSGRIHNLGRVE